MCKIQLVKPTLCALEYMHNRCTKSPPTCFDTPWVPSTGSAGKSFILGAWELGRAIYEIYFRESSSVDENICFRFFIPCIFYMCYNKNYQQMRLFVRCLYFLFSRLFPTCFGPSWVHHQGYFKLLFLCYHLVHAVLC